MSSIHPGLGFAMRGGRAFAAASVAQVRVQAWRRLRWACSSSRQRARPLVRAAEMAGGVFA
jgi:hypothetical protein